ncbi:Transposon Tf2-6 polyprotein [Labeo rohita]|uniref:Transposon Tf2-6 polyprotein n=1 Tax=Labeo rohita TaxID=84645 RepID=A0ABQ8L1M5_LABRO|nr:Transposon Tf2-6 polyprotein [Labeo rohita]
METAELLCNWVFRIFGLPEDIVSDRGPQFSSRLWSSFFRLLGVNVSLTSGYHPQANGQVERLNQELTRFLRSYCHNRQEDWSRYLFWAKYAQNSLRKPATHLTPFQCILGFQPPLFPWSGEPSELPAVNSWFQQSEETWNLAHVHLQRAIRRTQTQADRRCRPNPPYVPGQWVWLSTWDLRLHLPCKKLSPRYVARWRPGRSGEPRRDRPPGTPPPPSSTARRFIGEVTSNIWSTERASVPRRDPGSPPETSLTLRSPLTSTLHTQIDQLPVGGVDPGVGYLLTPGVARRGGALSPTRSLWLPPTAVSGNHHRTFNALHFPSPRIWDPHFRFRVLRVTSPLAAIYRPPGWQVSSQSFG